MSTDFIGDRGIGVLGAILILAACMPVAGNQADWQSGARRAYVEKRDATRNDIDLVKNPCFAEMADELFETGRVIQVFYWSGKITVHIPAVKWTEVNLDPGDHVELFVKSCHHGDYAVVTRKLR
jgi:hypothetical protein